MEYVLTMKKSEDKYIKIVIIKLLKLFAYDRSVQPCMS